MKYPALLVAMGVACLATSLPPFFHECSLIDRVGAAAKGDLPTYSAALEILERIAEGRMGSADPNLEARVGLERGQLHGPEFKNETVRSYALRRIGELDVPEIITYLQNLKKDDFQPDISGRMSSAAEIAFRQAQLNHIDGQQEKIRFLEETTRDRSAAAWWAVQELCNRGCQESLAVVRESIWRQEPTDRGREQADFCEARMAIIARDPSRTKALGSFLSTNNGGTDQELTGWAINELHDINSPAADAELGRYAHEIDQLPDGSLKTALRGKRVQIQNLWPHAPR